MNKILRQILTTTLLALIIFASNNQPTWAAQYNPPKENLEAREKFSAKKFGIFLHWGIYSTFAQGEWYLHNGKLDKDEYAKAASCFNPVYFNANQWIKSFKQGGANYICFTSRHHDGFSMFNTQYSDYNIMNTPFKRDIMKELANACHREGIGFHVYYSLMDWTREDYPVGSCKNVQGRKHPEGNYDSYFQFMKDQLTEILTQYGQVDAIWLDGMWDHKKDTPPFDWRLRELYDHIHSLQPACLIINNHHLAPFPGEDAQTFERDLPGENKAGFSKGTEVSQLPLEMCQTMNGMWGYKVNDQNYKSSHELLQLLVRAASKGANLLLNIGPQPNGELPATALQRLRDMGMWTQQYGETLYGTSPAGYKEAPWGITLSKGQHIFAHILNQDSAQSITLPIKQKVTDVRLFESKEKLSFKCSQRKGLTFSPPTKNGIPDLVVEIVLAEKRK